MTALWHDDVRLPSQKFNLWARTNDEAKKFLEEEEIIHISLDHDLGGHDLDPHAPETWLFRGPDDGETGHDLLLWMIKTGHMPPFITIHSWNPAGARKMMDSIAYCHSSGLYLGTMARFRPYEPT